jgi:predicted  nucleic acid-binding Zn-ribbon protein
MLRHMRHSSFAILSFIILAFVIQTASAQLPVARLNSAFPAGGKQGSTIEVTVTGTDLDGANRLYFTHPGITAKQFILEPSEFDPQPHPAEGKFTVNIAADVPPGMYEARAAGKYGVSNPRFFVVDTRPEVNETEPNSSVEQAAEVPAGGIVNGVANGGADRDFFQFPATKGQRLLIDCQARRIDSRLDPMLVLYDAKGNELASAHDGSHNDTLLDFTAPADGLYVVEVHDFIYAGGPDYFYRLAIGAGPHVDFVFPPAGLPGSNQTYQVYGRNLPGGRLVPNLTVDGRPLEVVAANIALPGPAEADRLPAGTLIEPAGSGIDALLYRHPSPQGPANPVLLGFATAPVVPEQEPNNSAAKAQKLTPPCECVGQFYPVGDHDWFTFDAKKGDTYVIEVVSQRLGEATDPYLLVEQVTVDKDGKEQIKELQQVDDFTVNSGGFDYDTVNDDPTFRFTAPDDGMYRMLVRDLYSSSRGDPRFVYRLAVRQEQPDFRLVAFPKAPGNQPNQQQSLTWTPYLRKGGSDEVDVVAFRRDGFDGEIVVTAEGLPPGVSAQSITIGPGRNSAVLVLSAADNATPTVAPFRAVGKAKIGTTEVVHPVRAASIVWAGQPGQFNARSRLSGELVLAVSESEPAPFSLLATVNVLEMSRAGKIEIPVTLTQHGDFKGNVTLSPVGLPPNIQPANQQMNAGPGETKFTLNLQTNAPTGTFSFHLLGTTQYNYRHNPEAAEAAAKRQAEIEKILAERQAALKAANDKKNAANQAAQQTDAEMKRLQQALQTAKNNFAAAETKLKAAQQSLAQAEAALDKNKEDKSLASGLDTAKKNAAATEDEAKKAADALTAAEKAFAEASAKAKEAAEAKIAADKAATEADAKVKSAEQARQTAVQATNQARNVANPRNINLGYPSTPVTIKITPAPITIAISPPAAALKQGGKLELPITINRLYGFTNPVQFNVQLPGGVGGLNIPQVTIAADQNQGMLVINAANNGTAGRHELRLQANLQFNNQNLQVLQSLPITIEQVEVAKK